MKLYTWYDGKLSHGIEVSSESVVELGDGSSTRKIGLSDQNPPEILNGRIFEAKISSNSEGLLKNKRNTFYPNVLEKADDNKTEEFLVHINTRAASGGKRGRAFPDHREKMNSPDWILKGYFDHQRAEDWLLILRKGTIITIASNIKNKDDVRSGLWVKEAHEPATASYAEAELDLAQQEGKALWGRIPRDWIGKRVVALKAEYAHYTISGEALPNGVIRFSGEVRHIYRWAEEFLFGPYILKEVNSSEVIFIDEKRVGGVRVIRNDPDSPITYLKEAK